MARRRRNKRYRRGRMTVFLRFLSFLLICGAIAAALLLFFKVDTLEVQGNERYTDEEILDIAGIEHGQNLFLLDRHAIADQITGQLPYIQSVKIRRDLPDTIVVEVSEAQAVAAVMADGEAWLISPSGRVVEQMDAAQAEGYAVISGCTLLAPSVGTRLALATEYAAQQQSLLDLLSALEAAGLTEQVQAIRLDDLSMLVMEYAGRFSVELPYGADYERKLRALVQVVEQLETNQAGVIQMTWDNGEVHFIEN